MDEMKLRLVNNLNIFYGKSKEYRALAKDRSSGRLVKELFHKNKK
jgi:hypothetical protein